jgi:hypothetical protein
MMKLSAVSAFFNQTTFSDAYRPFVKVKGRLLAQDDNSRDSLSTERRVLAVKPGTSVPARRVLTLGGQQWIVGGRSMNFHGDEALHEHYTLHRAEGLVKVLSYEEALSIAPGQSMYAGRLWVKDDREETESSRQYPKYQFFLSPTENILDPTRVDWEGSEVNVLITMDNRWYLVRDIISTAGGFQMAVTDQLPEPVIAMVAFSSMAYDMGLDKKVATTKNVNAINLRWQASFDYTTAYSEKFEPGDRQLAVLKSDLTPQAGDTVKLGPKPFKVMSKISQGNLWFVHIRPT